MISTTKQLRPIRPAAPLPMPRRRRPLAATAAQPPEGAGAVPGPEAQATAAQVMQVLPRVMDAMRLAMRAQLDGPLTVPQFRCLNFIDRHPGCSLSAVAGFLGVTLATASAMVDRLVRAGHLSALGDPTDRRRTALQLCDSGQAVLRQMRRRTCDDLARSLAGCSPAELQSLAAGLQVLQTAFEPIALLSP
jgi:DNA-binding MarR family transcriptional regulator